MQLELLFAESASADREDPTRRTAQRIYTKPAALVTARPWDAIASRDALLSRAPRGRWWHQCGSATYNHQLSETDVQVIRELWALGVSQRTIARAYNISQPHCCNIIRRRWWSHVPATDVERTALGCQQETTQQALATTGRLQRWNGSGWDTFADIRRAEIATGEDRIDIAKAALSGSGWRYEPGVYKDSEPDLW